MLCVWCFICNSLPRWCKPAEGKIYNSLSEIFSVTTSARSRVILSSSLLLSELDWVVWPIILLQWRRRIHVSNVLNPPCRRRSFCCIPLHWGLWSLPPVRQDEQDEPTSLFPDGLLFPSGVAPGVGRRPCPWGEDGLPETLSVIKPGKVSIFHRLSHLGWYHWIDS